MKSQINYAFLSRGLEQIEGKKVGSLNLDPSWLRTALFNRIDQIQWKSTQEDIAKFLRAQDQHILKVWSSEYFKSIVERYFKSGIV